MPDLTDSGITLQVIGHDSKAFREGAKRFGQRVMDGEKQTVDFLDSQNTELVATCIVGWTGLEEDDGTPTPYSHAKAVELMGMPELAFVREQVEAYAGKRMNFFSADKGEVGIQG